MKEVAIIGEQKAETAEEKSKRVGEKIVAILQEEGLAFKVIPEITLVPINAQTA